MRDEPCIETEAYRLLKSELSVCKRMRKNRVAIGPPGNGKSHALGRLNQEDGDASLLQVDIDLGKNIKAIVVAIFRMISGDYGRSYFHATTATALTQGLREQFAEWRGSKCVLIIDDAHNLDSRVLGDLCRWYEWGLPILFVGNDSIIHGKRARASAFAQISTRIYGDELTLPHDSPEDFQNLAAAYGVADRAALRFAEEYGVAKTLRELSFLLQEARSRCGNSKSIGLSTLREAAQDMGFTRKMFKITTAKEKPIGYAKNRSQPDAA